MSRKPLRVRTEDPVPYGAKSPEEMVKVHWEIPRDLLKRIKHKAIDQDKATIQVVREILERHI